MRYREIICEEPVQSTWISDLTLQNNGKDVTMALNTGRRYRVAGVGPAVYRQWVAAQSKGRFWHDQIRGNYSVERLV